jgi:hypothetical protein
MYVLKKGEVHTAFFTILIRCSVLYEKKIAKAVCACYFNV